MSVMGSCSSKMRPSALNDNDNDNGTRMFETEASPSGAAETEKTPVPTKKTNEEKAKVENAVQEKPVDEKLVQSFAWLAQAPDVLHTTPKDPKDKAKKPTEGPQSKSGTLNVTYTKGKYLKSAESATTSSNTKPKQRSHVGSTLTHTKCGEKNVDSCCQAKKRANEKNSGQKNNEQAAAASPRTGGAYPIGFGVIG